jgi:hypothetical protein
MENGESVECGRKIGQFHTVVPDLDVVGIPAATPVQSRESEGIANYGMDRIPVLDVKEIDPMAKDMRFIIFFDAEPLSRMRSSKAFLKFFNKVLRQIRWWPGAGFHLSAILYPGSRSLTSRPNAREPLAGSSFSPL